MPFDSDRSKKESLLEDNFEKVVNTFSVISSIHNKVIQEREKQKLHDSEVQQRDQIIDNYFDELNKDLMVFSFNLYVCCSGLDKEEFKSRFIKKMEDYIHSGEYKHEIPAFWYNDKKGGAPTNIVLDCGNYFEMALGGKFFEFISQDQDKKFYNFVEMFFRKTLEEEVLNTKPYNSNQKIRP